MSKIICDVCGTSYPETATQCPICGCVRSVDAKVVAGSTNEAESQAINTYAYVKGGRFSKANVKKRNSGKQPASNETSARPQPTGRQDDKKEIGVVITTIALLLAIITVVAYIVVKLVIPTLFVDQKPVENGNNYNDNTNASSSDTTDVNASETKNTTVLEIPCTEIVLSKTSVEFDSVDASLLLNVTTSPANTTDSLIFATSDEKIATVNRDGKITAVGGGEAVITIICGSVMAECKVVCNIDEPIEGTEPSAPSASDFKLNREDFTLTSKGQIWKLYSGDIAANQITWTSANEKVVTIKDGVVTAVGSGMTKVYGEYGGVKLSCIVRCSDSMGKADEDTSGNVNVPETTAPNGKYTISNTDVTLVIGEKFILTLKDANGNAVNVSWKSANTDICSVNGNEVTGVSVGQTKVFVPYEGAEYSCIVRVIRSRG